MKSMIKKLKQRLDLNKPFSLGWNEWSEWHKTTRRSRPVAYFIMETVPDFYRATVRTITAPYHRARNWIRYNLFDRMHVIPTGLEPGYHDVDTRMLHGMFNMLVDFVEVEQAWMHVVFSQNAAKKHRFPWYSIGWTRFRSFRNPQAGLDHLRWEMTLDGPNLPPSNRSPSQAANAREIWELYHWWKCIRPKRLDPHEASGWTAYCASRSWNDLFSNDVNEEDCVQTHAMINEIDDLEKQYDDEDQEMLIRLIKLRKSLWT